MTGDELIQLRKATRLSRVDFMREMGHSGASNTLFQRISRYESDRLEIPEAFARFAWLVSQAHQQKLVPFIENAPTPMIAYPIWQNDVGSPA